MKIPVISRLFLLVMLLLITCQPQAGERLQIAVSIIPQKNLLERIGGGLVDVHLLVRPGYSPSTYEPTPRQMVELAGADLYYRIGVPFERSWMDRIRDAHPNLPILDARDGIELRQIDAGGTAHAEHGHHHEKGELDPHIWLSPPLIKIMALRLRDRLIQLDPSHRDIYVQNHMELAVYLDQLDADIRQTLADLGSRKFMVYHPSWGYFADAYGLQQIPIESEGKEPSAQALGHLLDEARASGVGVIFVQKQFSQAQARSVAEAMAARIVVIDPLSEDYPKNLRAVAQAMATTLSN
jgi:zinc transport system substrate-binding protein